MLQVIGVLVENHKKPFSSPHCHGNTLAEAVVVLVAHCQFVDHYLYVVVFVAVEFHSLCYFPNLSVNACVEVALASHALEEFAIVSLAASHHRGEDKDFPSGIVGMNHLNNLFLSIFHHFLATLVAVCLSGSCEEKSHEVVDFGSGAHCGARVFVGCLLFDAYHRAKSCNLVNVGTFHSSEEVPRIG